MKYPNSNLKIIALNCLLCDTWNYNLINSDKKASKEMFIQLEKELRQSEKNNEYVYIFIFNQKNVQKDLQLYMIDLNI